jgi:hypothetical protein
MRKRQHFGAVRSRRIHGDLGGRKAQGGQGNAKLATARDATDSFAEQSLEVESSGGKDEERQDWQRFYRKSPGTPGSNGKEANGCGDTVRLQKRGVLRGVVQRGERPSRSRSFGFESRWKQNALNPRVGSRMQQACELRAEQTVEVVQNHEDGTGSSSMAARGPKGDGNVAWE